jgi:diketogulonate reductase-like aldo/keto reductase
LDYIDLYLIHWPIPSLEKRCWQTMEKIYQSGLVKSIGVSNYSISQLEKVLSVASVFPAVNQIKCSPFNYQPKMHEFCKKNNIALEAYSPLTRAHKLDDETLFNIAKKYKKSTAQILIRWALQKQIIVIPKSDEKVHIYENANVYDFNINIPDMVKLDNLAK